MVTLGANARLGLVGDSLTTGNEGTFGAVPVQSALYPAIASRFSGTSPAPTALRATLPAPASVTTFNRGAPTWSIQAVDGQNIQQIRAFLQNMPTNITHQFFEGGTNDLTNGVDPAVSNTQLIGAMNDAVARFPLLQAFFYVGVACIGEMYVVNGGVPSFSGNTAPALDTATDSLMATLKASVLAQTGTNSLGQPIQFVYLDMRTTSVNQLFASGNPPPWQNNGYLTVDGRHPFTGGLPVSFQTVTLANLTIVVP